MSDTPTQTQTSPTPDSSTGTRKSRLNAVQPVLEKLFEFYPKLFGAKFLPLKLGIYQDLLAAHPEVFSRPELKAALGVHARSTRYLQAVAAGLARHDLNGLAVEPVAPEHQFLAIVELHQRRQARSQEDLSPKLVANLAACYSHANLSRQDYLARLGTPTALIAASLDQAIEQVEQQRAHQAALVKAFEASGQTLDEFAASLGMEADHIRGALPNSGKALSNA
jgi:hypothetical protein